MSFYKNGIITTNAFSNDFPIMDMELKVLDDNSIWARILHHNNKSGSVLFTASNVMNIQTTDLYSRLYLLENFRTNDNLFEFLVIQPQLSATTYYRWKQSNNPTNTTALTDFTNISNMSTGLVKCSGNTLMAISTDTNNWWQATGCYTKYQGGIPGFGNKIVTQSLDLYVRINDKKNLNKFNIYNKTLIANQFYEM